MLFQPIQGFNIIKLPPYRAPKSQQDAISKTDQIAFMVKFYPPPQFAKLILIEPQTSSSSKISSQKSFKDSQRSDIQSNSQQKSFTQQKEDIKQYEVSQIKPPNKGFVDHSRKLREMSLKDNENEESEFQYRQLLLDLSFQQKHNKSASFQRKPKNKNFHFELSERDHYQHSLNDIVKDQLLNEDGINEQKGRLVNHKTHNYFKWDSQSEILFKKQNRIKRMVRILNKKRLQTQKDLLEKLKKDEKVTRTISSKEKSLQRFKWNKKRKESSKIFKVQVDQTKRKEILHTDD